MTGAAIPNSIKSRLCEAVLAEAQKAGLTIPDTPEARNGHLLDSALAAGLSSEAIGRALADTLGLEFVADLSHRKASQEFLRRVPISYARDHRLLGLETERTGCLDVAIADAGSAVPLDVISRRLGVRVRPLVCTAERIAHAVNRAYERQAGEAELVVKRLDRKDVLAELRALEGREDLLDSAGRAPVVKLVNLMLFEAVQQQASDVHVEPHEEKLYVRMRIDGVLFDAYTLPKSLQEEVASRIKVMGRMNIAEKRLPQDGRATVRVGDRTIDLRLSAVPASFGERLVIRLLDKSTRLFSLDELGMDAGVLASFKRMVTLEHGLVLVTGPTGSGKSTTLYAALSQIDAKRRNIITLEDPIEYRLDRVSQIQVSDRKGMTFAGGLRSVLRQDPDIIMVGEIRDRETAVMAIQSALTGHLVFSTLHTNDAASAVTRLLDLGIEPYLLASSLIGVQAQRLVRRVCAGCAEPYKPSLEELGLWGREPTAMELGGFRVGRGCATCRGTGYQGRMGIFELLPVNDAVRHLIQHRATAGQIKAEAVRCGMKTLQEDGLDRVARGATTLEEVTRVTCRQT